MKIAYTLHSVLAFDRQTKAFVETVPGSLVEMTDEVFAEASGRGSVREASENEQILFAHGKPKAAAKPKSAPTPAPAASSGDALVLKAKHKGGGRFVVVDADDVVVSGDELFDDKAAAEDWIAKRSAPAGDLNDLVNA